MDPLTVLTMIRTAASAATAAKAAFDQVKHNLSSNDEAELKAELDKMQQANDALYQSVQAKLSKAAGDAGT